MEENDLLAVDPLESVVLDGPEKVTYVSSLLSSKENEHLQRVLLRNIDVCTWNHLNMTGIDLMLASHKLNIIQTEVDNLLREGFIKEVKYPEWLANVVVIPKKGGKWRVCVDYTDLNEACSKDSFPLPRIDQIVYGSSGHRMMSSLDAFSRYHQIPMHPPHAEKKTFITSHGLSCYNVMSFGLKNVRATYQRLVIKIFRPLIGKTMEVVIDDMLVKSKEHLDHMKHLQETFELLHTYDMKLNPLKCVFGINSDKFLDFMITHRGIEANPIQLRDIIES